MNGASRLAELSPEPEGHGAGTGLGEVPPAPLCSQLRTEAQTGWGPGQEAGQDLGLAHTGRRLH